MTVLGSGRFAGERLASGLPAQVVDAPRQLRHHAGEVDVGQHDPPGLGGLFGHAQTLFARVLVDRRRYELGRQRRVRRRAALGLVDQEPLGTPLQGQRGDVRLRLRLLRLQRDVLQDRPQRAQILGAVRFPAAVDGPALGYVRLQHAVDGHEVFVGRHVRRVVRSEYQLDLVRFLRVLTLHLEV